MHRNFLITCLVIITGFIPSAFTFAAEVKPDSLLAHIGVLQTEIQCLTNQLPGMVGEDSLIIDHEIKYAQLKALDQIYLMINFLAGTKETRPIKPAEQELINSVPLSFIIAEKNVSTEVKKLRARRKQIPAHNMGEYEENIADLMAQMTSIQKHMFDYLMALEKLGKPDDDLSLHLRTSVQDRTRLLIGRLRISMKDQHNLKRRITVPAAGDDAVLLQANGIRTEANVTSLRDLLALMNKLDLDTTTQEAYLIESTGKLTTADLFSGALLSFLRARLQGILHSMRVEGVNILINILMTVLIVFVFHYLAKVVSKLVMVIIDASRFNASTLVHNMIETMSSRLVMLVGIIIALSQLGISLVPMLAGLGVVGFIVGFALQDTLANFASGMMILMYRPFDVGDMVETGTVFGKVRHMSLVSTTIHTIDNQTVVVPNNMIWGNVIKNVTDQNLRRVDMTFGISYSDDIPMVEKLLMDILDSNKMVLKSPAPMVKLHELADSSVNFVVRPWVRTDDYWDVHWDVTREVKMRFDAEGIRIPFPQQDVHLYEDKSKG